MSRVDVFNPFTKETFEAETIEGSVNEFTRNGIIVQEAEIKQKLQSGGCVFLQVERKGDWDTWKVIQQARILR